MKREECTRSDVSACLCLLSSWQSWARATTVATIDTGLMPCPLPLNIVSKLHFLPQEAIFSRILACKKTIFTSTLSHCRYF